LKIGQALGKYTKTYVNVGFLGFNVDIWMKDGYENLSQFSKNLK
jgi:hypothetical protein